MSQAAVDALVDLLDLEQIEVNIFRGRSPTGVACSGSSAGRWRARRWSPPAAPRTGSARCTRCTRTSCGPGGPGVPIVYQVDRVRDGRSFTTRAWWPCSTGRTIFNLTASFHKPERRHRAPAADGPEVPGSRDAADARGRGHGELPEALERMAPASPSTSATWTGCAGSEEIEDAGAAQRGVDARRRPAGRRPSASTPARSPTRAT